MLEHNSYWALKSTSSTCFISFEALGKGGDSKPAGKESEGQVLVRVMQLVGLTGLGNIMVCVL